MDGKKEQIRQSKEKIVEATFRLLEKDSFDQLTLNEVLEEAGVSRRTFYRYFQNKQAILDFYCDTFVENYHSLGEIILEQTSFESVLLITLDYFKANQPKLRLLIINQQFQLLLSKFNDVAVTIYQSMKAPWHVQSDSTKSLDDILYFIVGGYFNIISHWLIETHPRDSTEIALNIKEMFYQIANTFDLNNVS